MNIIISDTHNKHKLIPSKYIDNVDGEFDMIIHAGDISSTGSKNEIRVFFNWYSKLPYKYIILIAGNHDFSLKKHLNMKLKLLAEYPTVIYLNDSGVEIDGLKFWVHQYNHIFIIGPLIVSVMIFASIGN
jgi:predicted phosphodiesterase